jgi:hypothetical protein
MAATAAGDPRVPPSPDATLFAALLARRPPAGEDVTTLVIELTEAVREASDRLGEASRFMTEPRGAWSPADVSRLARLIEAAERASRVQTECTAELLRATVGEPLAARAGG